MRLREASGITFNQSLQSKREFHNPNISEFLNRLGGLDEYGTNDAQLAESVLGREGVPDFEALSKEQRAEWERKHPSEGQAQHRARPISFTAGARPTASAPSSYAALLQERRNQQHK